MSFCIGTEAAEFLVPVSRGKSSANHGRIGYAFLAYGCTWLSNAALYIET